MKKVLLFSLLTLTLAACQREADLNPTTTPNPNPTPTQPASGTRFAGLYISDSTRPAGQDTLSVLRVTYDAQGRPQTVTIFDKIPNGDSSVTRYLYQGSDTIANRIASWGRYNFSGTVRTSTDTTFYQYNGTKLGYDSVVSWSSTGFAYVVNKRVHHGDRIFHTSYSSGPSIPSGVQGTLSVPKFNNGCITSQEDTSAEFL